MLDYEKIGKFIANKRIKNGLTQEQLADKLFVTRQAISRWEQGKSVPDYDSLINLCKLFDVTIEELLCLN